MRREFWRNFDYWLFGSVSILSIFGIIVIRSSIAGNEELAGLVNRQSIYVAIGLVLILVIALIDYHYWASLTRLMYVGMIIFLALILVIGIAQFGSARRVDTGIFFIQPSELAKIVLILVLADSFSRNQEVIHGLRWIIRSLLLTAGIVVLILLQPNLSTSIVMMVIWFTMLWISGLPPRYLLYFGGFGLLLLMVFLTLLALRIQIPFIEEYQMNRIVNFLFPDPNARHGNAYNVEQALITIGSGGWFGQGYGHSSQVQLRFLKVRHTDFIFSVMAAEFGFIGTIIIIGLLAFVIFRCLRAARLASDSYGALIAYGFTSLLSFQTMVNIGVNLNVLPVTGLTLPFISYGGSSLISLVVGIGLVESIVARQKSLEL